MNPAHTRTRWPLTTLLLLMLVQQTASLARFAEGGVINWINAGGGSFGIAQNWSPMQVPGFLDIARFDLGDQSYEVDFLGLDRSTRRVIIGDDDLVFDLGGATFETFASTNSLVVGETTSLLVAFRDTASLTVFDGEMTAVNLILGRDSQPGAHGTTVRASGRLHLRGSLAPSTMTIGDALVVGDAGSGTLEVDYGGVLQGDGGAEYTATIANQAGSLGTALVERGTWSNIGTLRVGNAGDGSLDLTNAGMVTARRAYVAAETGSIGNVVVGGSGDESRLLVLDQLEIGGESGSTGGQATVTVYGGGSVSGRETTISDSGTVVLDGGRFSVHTLTMAPQATFDWLAGRFTIRDLAIDSGAPLGDFLTIGPTRELEVWNQLQVAPAGHLTLDGGLIATDELDLDGQFTWTRGVLHITDDLVIETDAPIGDHLTVAGEQSLLVEELPGLAGLRTLHVGQNQAGMLTVGQGGMARADEIKIGSSGDGTITVTDPGTLLTTPRTLEIAAAGQGQLIVSNGAQVSAQYAQIGMQQGAEGSVTVQGLGSSLYVATDSTGPTLPIGGEGSGVVNVLTGAVVQTQNLDIVLGESSGGAGTINIDGLAAWQFLNPSADTITIGRYGDGFVNITGGSTLTSGRGVVAQEAGVGSDPPARGFVTIAGQDTNGIPSVWNPTFLVVADGGEGHLDIIGGGLLVTGAVEAGGDEFAEGHIRVDGAGSELRVAAPADANLVLGQAGRATLEVSGAGRVSAQGVFIGDGPGGVATTSVTGAGSVITATENVVGWYGNGSLDVSAGGSVVSGTGAVAVIDGSGGDVVLDSGGSWRVASDLTLGDGEGAIHVRNGGQLDVGGSATIGPLSVIEMQGGTLTAATIDTQPGGTFDFQTGTLHVDTFDGDLVNVGGTLAPGRSPGITAVIGDYEQQAEATLAIEIGGEVAGEAHDLLTVSSAAVLDGELQLSLIDGFLPALYDSLTIINTEDGIQGIFGEVDGVGYAPNYGLAVTYGSNHVEVQGALLGDANLDGEVDGTDFMVWRDHRFTSGNSWATGDFNGDGFVDGRDLFIWNAHKFMIAAPSLPVPEPDCGLVAVVLVMSLLKLRGWRGIAAPSAR